MTLSLIGAGLAPPDDPPDQADNEDMIIGEEPPLQQPVRPVPADEIGTQMQSQAAQDPEQRDDTVHDPEKSWNFKNLPRARFKNGRREIRVEWEDGFQVVGTGGQLHRGRAS